MLKVFIMLFSFLILFSGCGPKIYDYNTVTSSNVQYDFPISPDSAFLKKKDREIMQKIFSEDQEYFSSRIDYADKKVEAVLNKKDINPMTMQIKPDNRPMSPKIGIGGFSEIINGYKGAR